MRYLGKFENEGEARECAKEKNGFVKKQSYHSGKGTLVFWYVYPRKEIKGE